MSSQGKGGGGDEPDPLRQQEEAKSSAILNAHTQAKVAFDGATFHARSGEREAEQGKRPDKERPQNPPPIGILIVETHEGFIPLARSDEESQTDGDEGDGGGDEGGSKSGDSSRGGPSPNLDLTTSDYVAFADVVSVESKVTTKQPAKNRKDAEMKVETAETDPTNQAKITGPKAAPPQAGTAKPGASPSVKGPGATPSGGGKSGPSSGGGTPGPGL